MRDVFVLHGEYGPGLPFGCTHIRLLRPLSHPSLAGKVRLRHGTHLPSDRTPDAVIVERIPPGLPERALADAEAIVYEAGRRGLPLVYTTDDNLLDVHRVRPWDPAATTEVRAAVRLLARRAVGVVASTEALKERMAALNPRIVTIPSFLDERLFGPPSRPERHGGPLVIGYMGTRTHDGDLRMILRPLRELLQRSQGAVRLEVVGVVDGASVPAYFGDLPVTSRDPGREEAYPSFPRWMRRTLSWHLALAPLEANAFAGCKSDLKYLDYGALGIPAVFSDVAAYRETVRHRETGLLVSNEPDAWAAALDELVRDGDLRTRLGRAAQAEVHGTRMLRTNAARWVEALDAILGPAR